MRKLRIGIIGTGSWGECHLEALRGVPQAEIAAICDTREDRLHAVGEKFGVEQRYTSEEELIAVGDIDLVSVVTYEKDHMRPALASLRAGKHVLVEKPVSTSAAEAQAMKEAAAECGRHLIPGHLLRFDSRYAEVAQAIESGSIGDPVSMYFRRSRVKSLLETYQRTHTVYELAVHDIDLVLWYSKSRVRTVKAYARYVTGKSAPDVLWACLEMENGAVAVLQSDWMTPDAAGIAMDDSLRVIGTRGTACLETAHNGFQIWREEGRFTPDIHIHFGQYGRYHGALREQYAYICDGILHGRELDRISFDDAIAGVEITDAIVRSCETGETVRL
jgi:predicted dehydrogenase